MLLLLPPLEGKASGAAGRPVRPDDLSFPALAPQREKVLDALVALCSADPVHARGVLGLPVGLSAEVDRDAALRTAPALPVSALYTGVLFAALGLATLDAAARRRAARQVVVVSGLWGALRPSDRVPAYRLSMGVDLPGTGPLAAAWRAPLAQVLPEAAGGGLVVDLRSAAYAAAWTPRGELASRTVGVRVLVERDAVRSVVSHRAKRARGLIARHLLTTRGAAPQTPAQLHEHVRAAFRAELVGPARAGRPSVLELLVEA